MPAGLLRTLWQPYLIKMAAEPESLPQQLPAKPSVNMGIILPALVGSNVGTLLAMQHAPDAISTALSQAPSRLIQYRRNLVRRLVQKHMGWDDEYINAQRMGALGRQLKSRPKAHAAYLRRQNPLSHRISTNVLTFLHRRPWILGAAGGMGGALAGAGLAGLIHSMAGD